MRNIKAFTLIELMVVILIVGILAAASIPLMRGRIDSAKWSEANATAGTIRSAARVYEAEHGDLTGVDIDDLGFQTGELEGTYFNHGDYGINIVNGRVEVVITGSKTNSPPGTATLDSDGNWSVSGN